MKKQRSIAVEKSQNSKTGIMAVTYSAQQSCPSDCPFMNNGCYAEKGLVGIHTRRLNKTKSNPYYIAIEEAKRILQLSGERVLRLHVVGDCATPQAAQIVSIASSFYKRKHNQPVYTYTHAWKKVHRKYWGNVSVLASVHTQKEQEEAAKQGYAPAIALEGFPNGPKAFKLGEITYIPCPEQAQTLYGKNKTKKIQCVDCKLCFDADKLLKKMQGIAFSQEAH